MLLQRIKPKTVLPTFRRSQSRAFPVFRSSALKCRLSSTTATSSKPGVKKARFPERLIIYHAGTGRTVFLGCLKVTTIFICAFFCAVMAPTHFYAEESNWVAAGVMISGLVPVSVVAYISAPFVTYIHLRLPIFARQSQEMLLRYSKSLPKNAELDITTMNFIGKPRVTRVKAGDLRAVKERFGFANYCRDTKVLNSKRPWWMGKAVRQFGVTNERSGVMGGEIWENVAKGIKKNQKSD
ncbi:hypothetical protein BKA65DRAFT_554739 [Rhexocercosporidium sp. MPI-PUGE-AT-0058]|nr:hypothetical protein BKA65DRAFT_554739 [Rhexocercosporidium sp. MPI-PUGE-AT-0058]